MGKGIWGKGMGAEKESHALARNSLAISPRSGFRVAIFAQLMIA